MVEYKRTQEVKAPPERVFRHLTEVERFPEMFPDIFTRMEVVGKEGDSRIILCEERWAGRHFRYTMKEKLSPPERIEHVITQGNGKGSTQILALAEIPDGTLLTMTIEAKGLAATVLGRLFRKKFEEEMNQIFERYMKVVEASK